jgi:hypothetical protein
MIYNFQASNLFHQKRLPLQPKIIEKKVERQASLNKIQ